MTKYMIFTIRQKLSTAGSHLHFMTAVSSVFSACSDLQLAAALIQILSGDRYISAKPVTKLFSKGKIE